MNTVELNNEFETLKVKVLHKTTGANVHKAENLIGAAQVIVNEYAETNNAKWLALYFQTRKKIIKFLNVS